MAMVNKIMTKLIVVIFVAFVLSSKAQAAFRDMLWGTRASGLAGAFSALADDASAPLYNPAGVAQLEMNEFSLMYARLYAGLNLLAGDNNTDFALSNLSFVPKCTGEKKIHTAISWTNFTSLGLYREDTLLLTLANNLNDYFPNLPLVVLTGINLKYLHHSFTLDSKTNDDPVFHNQRDKNAFGIDAGILVNPNIEAIPGLGIGVSVQNVNEPDVGISSKDKVPKTIRAGIAYQAEDIPYFIPSVEYTYREKVSNFGGGIESWLLHQRLGFRLGAGSREAAFGMSYYHPLNDSQGLRLDYTLLWPFLIEDSGGSHRLSLSLYF